MPRSTSNERFEDPGNTGKQQADPSVSTRARIGAYTLHSRYDSKELTKAGRAAFLSKFERDVDPEGVLAPAERGRRAEQAKRAHFQRLAYLSAKSRRKRKGGGKGGDDVAA